MENMQKKKLRTLKDIPELVEVLREQKAREKDYLVKQENIRANSADGKPHLSLLTSDGAKLVGIMEQTHGQLADKQGIPKAYYDRMAGGDALDVNLWAVNMNHWLAKENRKRRFIRLLDDKVRAFLGSKYRPISHLDILTTVVQTIMGKVDGGGGYSEGARCFAWTLSPTNMDVAFVNPRMGVDLNDLGKGIQTFGPEDMDAEGFYRYMRNDPRGGGAHWVFPSARHRNSETGHGGQSASRGFFEGYCMNGAFFGKELQQVHIGRELQEADIWSAETLKKMNELIFSKVKDITKETFEPSRFLATCQKFKGLEVEEVNVRVAADQVAALAGMTEDVRDEILDCYYKGTQARGNLFDFQRAVTAAAHSFREEKPDLAGALEDLGGDIVTKGKEALVKA